MAQSVQLVPPWLRRLRQPRADDRLLPTDKLRPALLSRARRRDPHGPRGSRDGADHHDARYSLCTFRNAARPTAPHDAQVRTVAR